MKIKVKFINGNNSIYDCTQTDILSLKKLIGNDKDISDENIKLIYRGKILKNEESFDMHKIDEESTLHCVVRKPNLQNNNNVSQTINNNVNIQNTSESLPNLNSIFQNMSLTDNNISNIFQNQDPAMINQINTMYQIPQFRELIISNTLARMNLPIDSPYRHVIENNISNLLQNPQMTNQIINNINNLNQSNQISQNLQNNNSDYESSTSNNEPEINFNELKEKYSSELEEIKSMGFDDENLILKTLSQSQGSVVISINKLLA